MNGILEDVTMKFKNSPNRAKNKRYRIKRVKIGNYTARANYIAKNVFKVDEYISMTKHPGTIPRKFTSWKHCIDVMHVLQHLDFLEDIKRHNARVIDLQKLSREIETECEKP